MRLNATTRETARGWVLASGIAAATIGLFLTAILLGGARTSGAASPGPDASEWARSRPPCEAP